MNITLNKTDLIFLIAAQVAVLLSTCILSFFLAAKIDNQEARLKEVEFQQGYVDALQQRIIKDCPKEESF